MTTKIFLCSLLLMIGSVFFSCSNKTSQSNHLYKSEKGLVPDESTAIKVAEAIWYPVYGNGIDKEKPFVAKLVDEIWIVKGTIKTDFGGALYIEIQKKDCKILKMYHGK
ncbi:MAG: YbbC/YhhH family protein [Cyclobacteriaceae bacterium]